MRHSHGSIRIGTGKREGALACPGKDAPGPGNYDVRGNIYGPSYGFGSGGRNKDRVNDGPGPGQYKLPYHVAEVPRYLIPNKPEEFRWI